MHLRTQRLLVRIGMFALPMVAGNFWCLAAQCQVNAAPGNRGRQVQIDVTIRDGSGGWCPSRPTWNEALKVSQQAEAESNGRVPQVDLLLARALTAVGRYEDSAGVLRELFKNHGDVPEGATARRFLERLAADGKINQPSNS